MTTTNPRSMYDDAYMHARKELFRSFNEYGEVIPLQDIPTEKLRMLDWTLTTMSGLISAEIVRRDRTSDFA